jgi:hypothetical protein
MAQDECDIERETGGLEIDVCKMEERRVRNILKGTAPYTHEPPASRSRTVRRGLAIFAAGVIIGASLVTVGPAGPLATALSYVDIR